MGFRPSSTGFAQEEGSPAGSGTTRAGSHRSLRPSRGPDRLPPAPGEGSPAAARLREVHEDRSARAGPRVRHCPSEARGLAAFSIRPTSRRARSVCGGRRPADRRHCTPSPTARTAGRATRSPGTSRTTAPPRRWAGSTLCPDCQREYDTPRTGAFTPSRSPVRPAPARASPRPGRRAWGGHERSAPPGGPRRRSDRRGEGLVATTSPATRPRPRPSSAPRAQKRDEKPFAAMVAT